MTVCYIGLPGALSPPSLQTKKGARRTGRRRRREALENYLLTTPGRSVGRLDDDAVERGREKESRLGEKIDLRRGKSDGRPAHIRENTGFAFTLRVAGWPDRNARRPSASFSLSSQTQRAVCSVGRCQRTRLGSGQRLLWV